MITHLLIDMINVFRVVYGKYPKMIILSLQLEKEVEEELVNFKTYNKHYQEEAKFKGIKIEYRLSEDFITLSK